MSKNSTLLVVLGFVAGCGAAAAMPLMVPPAHAQTTQRWEGYCAEHASRRGIPPGVTQIVTAAGREGWELVSVTGTFDATVLACFKRPAR